MAEQTKQEKKATKQESKKEPAEPKKRPQEESNEILVRVFGYDIPGSRNIYAGLTRIKGVSWSISNAACIKLGLNRIAKVSELTKDQIQKIEGFLKELDIPDFMKNRRKDEETGKTRHIFGSDLEITREFDVKKMRKIRSYKGLRHALKLPVRGQRTRSHFRQKGKSVGVQKTKAKPGAK